MEKHVEPLVTNSESEEKVVKSVAKLVLGALFIASVVAGAKSCEEGIDNSPNSQQSTSEHLIINNAQ